MPSVLGSLPAQLSCSPFPWQVLTSSANISPSQFIQRAQSDMHNLLEKKKKLPQNGMAAALKTYKNTDTELRSVFHKFMVKTS